MTSPVSPSETIAKAMEGKNHIQGMVRSIDQYRNGNPKAVADGSYAQVLFALQDMRHDILVLWDFAVSTALQLEAMQREMAGKDAEASWHPITTCPIREPVDLWCVYGGEEFAQYDGGASIGKVVPNRHKTEEYGFFGNQSNDGVPQGHARDLIPVAWRKAVPQCPSELIAEVLGIPRTIEDARALIGGGDD